MTTIEKADRNTGCNICQGRYECMICLYMPSKSKSPSPEMPVAFKQRLLCPVCNKLHEVSYSYKGKPLLSCPKMEPDKIYFTGEINMEIDNLTLGQIKQLKNLLGGVEQLPIPFTIGEKVFIRTVTHYLTGQVKEIVGKFLILTDAAWIADTGRFADALAKGTLNEVEPIPDTVRINSDTIVDAFPWPHALPRDQK